VNLAIAGHSLQRLWVNTEQLCCFIAVQEWLEDEFMSGPGLAWRRSEPRRLGCGHNELLSQIARIELIWLLLEMFYKCRLSFSQTGMIFGENAMKVTNLEGLQDGGSRLGQSVSILMNWRTGFAKRSQ
jgi:hypothetical protein